jgi:hypothetical protein
VEWTDAPAPEVSRSVLQHHWRQLADWSSARWRFPLAVVRDEPATLQRLRLDRHTWRAHRSVEVTIEGLEPCMPMFVLDGDAPAPRVSAAD